MWRCIPKQTKYIYIRKDNVSIMNSYSNVKIQNVGVTLMQCAYKHKHGKSKCFNYKKQSIHRKLICGDVTTYFDINVYIRKISSHITKTDLNIHFENVNINVMGCHKKKTFWERLETKNQLCRWRVLLAVCSRLFALHTLILAHHNNRPLHTLTHAHPNPCTPLP